MGNKPRMRFFAAPMESVSIQCGAWGPPPRLVEAVQSLSMFWEFFSLSKLANHAEVMRRQHSAWLTRAMRRPTRYPTIPVRPVGEGGFSGLMSTPAGREWAEEWWSQTLQNDDLSL